ncbi:uncharacterized protein LOC130667674 [Microplitis mediator]|uniref:uncharacterized protein LOC130667674 n=1 Tax=Microplitis mediator TaxID=375433 RepID=UPI002556817A|nr:uncharacterized protein LOC130667674 [Microplitis mediator]
MTITKKINKRNTMLSQAHRQNERPLTQRILSHIHRMKKKQFLGPNSPLYTSVCPLVYIIRGFGLAPYEFEDNQLVPCDSYMIISFFWLFMYTYIISGFIIEFIDSEKNRKKVLLYAEQARTVFNFSVVVTDLLLCMRTRKEITWIWNKIQDYDQAMRDLGYAKNEKRASMWVWFIIGGNIIIWGSVSSLGMIAFNEAWLHNVSFMIVYVGAAASMTKFSGLVMILGDRFKQLNEIARSSVQKSRWIHTYPIIDDKLIDCLHSELTAIGNNINKVYKFSLLLWLANLSFHSVCCGYFVLDWLLDGNFHWKYISCLSAWFVASVCQLFLIHYSCHYTSSEANCMSYIMLGWKRWLYTHDSKMDVETSIHLVNRQLHFSAAGCFYVNLPLLHSTAAILTTYMVILLQID